MFTVTNDTIIELSLETELTPSETHLTVELALESALRMSRKYPTGTTIVENYLTGKTVEVILPTKILAI